MSRFPPLPRFRPLLTFVGLFGLLTIAVPARADFYDLVSQHRDDATRTTRLLVLRQQADVTTGFDLWFLETWRYGQSAPESSQPLGTRDRDLWVRLGQLEWVQEQIAEDRKKGIEDREKEGFLPVDFLWNDPGGGVAEVALPLDNATLKLTLQPQGDSFVLTLVGPSDSVPLTRPLPAPVKNGASRNAASVRIRQVALLGRGRVLAVVLRIIQAPASPDLARDELFLIHTGKPLRRLGCSYPMVLRSPQDPESAPQEKSP